MRIGENKLFANISATPASFTIQGGLYQFSVIATWGGGNVVLNRLGPDGSTYIAVSATFTANGGATYYLPPGTYQLAITTATAVYAELVSIGVD